MWGFPFIYRCSNGYYGNPLSEGDFCKPCDCNGNADPYQSNWCDHRTGECLKCLGNTAGWKCDQCLEGHYGNPLSGECKGKLEPEYISRTSLNRIFNLVQLMCHVVMTCNNTKLNFYYSMQM